MVRKKIVVVNGEISEKEFEQLSDKEQPHVRKVDYDALIARLDGRYLTVKTIGEEMLACSNGLKNKVYYSEVLGAIKRLQTQGKINVERRVGQRVYYHITKVA